MRIVLLIICLAIAHSCSQKVKTYVFDPGQSYDFVSVKDSPKYKKNPCRDPLNYVPDETYSKYFDKRTVRINFHFPDDSTRSNNFNPGEGETYFTNMVNNCNYRFDINKKMSLPEGNNTPNHNPQFQLQITPSNVDSDDDGFYFEVDNTEAYFINRGRDRNNYKREVIKKHAINSDTILNAFIMPHHPDSLISKTYKTFGSGIALGSSVKVAGIYQLGGKDWEYATLLNHEIGHVFGLSHAWNTDGCDDTPKHANCFHKSGKKPCDGAVSNNLMDYNNSQMAISPCQLGKIHRKISDTSAFQRDLIIPSWCELQEDNDIIIQDTVAWLGGRDVSRNIQISDGGHLTACCRLSMPKGSSITVHPGGKLTLQNITLHNDCDDIWYGIKVISEGKKSGKIEQVGSVTILDVVKESKT